MVCCRSGRHAAFTILLVTTYIDKQRTLLAALTSDLWLTSNLTHSTCPAAAADSSAVIPFYTPITPTRYSVGLLASLSSRWLSTCHWDHVRHCVLLTLQNDRTFCCLCTANLPQSVAWFKGTYSLSVMWTDRAFILDIFILCVLIWSGLQKYSYLHTYLLT